MLADVDAGSDTPSLVGKVLKWRKANSAEGMSYYHHPGTSLTLSNSEDPVGHD